MEGKLGEVDCEGYLDTLSCLYMMARVVGTREAVPEDTDREE